MKIETLSIQIALLDKLLQSSIEQSTEMVEKLIKVNVQNKLAIKDLENMGQIIDMYI
jgi:hypothetical protein